MFTYDLNNITPERFAKLCGALLLKTVSTRVRLFDPVGPDAGRDGDLEGRGTGSYESLDGYWVFQFKHHDVYRLGAKKSRELVRADFAHTLAKLFEPNRKSVDFFILMTNVPFSGDLKTGMHGWFEREVSQFPLKMAEVWDYTRLEALINSHEDLRKGFFGDIAYADDFLRRVAANVSSNSFWEGLEVLLAGAGSTAPMFESRDAYETIKQMLWDLYESICLVGSGMSTISQYAESWHELSKLIQPALQNRDYKIRLGRFTEVKHKSGSGSGGFGSVWTALHRLTGEVRYHSEKAHRAILEVVERNRTIANIIANRTRQYFESTGYLEFDESDKLIVSRMQFKRFQTVEQALHALDRGLPAKDERDILEGHMDMEAATLFCNSIILTEGLRLGVQSALKELDRSILFDR